MPVASEAAHRYAGTDFQMDGVAYMHSHGPTWLDIRLSRDDQASVLKSGQALPHRFAPQAGWVSFRIKSSQDLANGRKIIQLAYEYAKKNLEEIKSRRMKTKLE